MGNIRKLKYIANQQRGYFTTRQATEAGYSNVLCNYYVTNGHWHKVDRSVYRLAGYTDNIESQFIRWALWAVGEDHGRRIAISHYSAFYYYGLQGEIPLQTHLSITRPLRRKVLPKECNAYLTDLATGDYVRKTGFNITTPYRTLCDLRPDLLYNSRWLDTVHLALNNSLIDREIASELLGEMLYKQMFDTEQSWAKPDSVGSNIKLGEAFSGKPSDIQRSAGMNNVREPAHPGRSQCTKLIVPNRSFTLIEMLVVIAILCFLAGMLMPALGKALTTARQSHCANNLQQISTGLFLYADDNQQTLPYAMNAAGILTWGDQIAIFLGMSYPGNALPASRYGIFNCPENSKQMYLCGTSGTEKVCSYTGNGNFSEPNNGGLPLEGTKLSRIKRPGKLNLVYDGVFFRCEPWSNDGAGVVPSNLQGFGMRGCRFVHSGQSINMLYADGHIKSLLCPLEYRGAWLGGNNYTNAEAWYAY